MARSDPEVLLISKILREGIETSLRLGVNRSMFHRWQDVWDYVYKFYNQYHKEPSVTAVKSRFENFTLLSAKDPIEHYIDELHWSSDKANYIGFVNKLNETIKSGNREDAKILTTDLYKNVVCKPTFSDDIIGSEAIKDTKSILKGIKEYLNTTIPTGLPVLDDVISGWGPGEFIAYIAPPYSAKTWMLINSAVAAVNDGHRVLFLSCEMPPDKVWLRFISLLLGLPATRLKQDRLTETEKKELFNASQLNGDIVVIGSYKRDGMTSLRQKVLQYAPDILFIDAWYALTKKDRGEARWEALVELATDLKYLLMEMGIPGVVTHQANREAVNKPRGASLADIAGTFDLAAWLDIAIMLAMTDDLRKTNELGIVARKIREFNPMSFTVRMNVDEGTPITTVQSNWVLERANTKGQGLTTEDVDQILVGALGK